MLFKPEEYENAGFTFYRGRETLFQIYSAWSGQSLTYLQKKGCRHTKHLRTRSFDDYSYRHSSVYKSMF